MKSLFRIKYPLILSLLCSLFAVGGYGEDLIFYDKNYYPLRGIINAMPQNNKLTVSSTAGPTNLQLDELMAVFAPENVKSFIELLKATNYKELYRQGYFTEYRLQKVVDKAFWQKMETLLPAQNDQYIVLSFKINKTGSVREANIIHNPGHKALEVPIIEALNLVTFKPLPSQYTGEWVPGFIILNPVLAKQELFLLTLQEQLELQLTNLMPKANGCVYRIQLLYGASGEPVFSRVFSSKQVGTSVIGCTISSNNPLLQALKKEKHPGFNWPQEGLLGLSLWFKQESLVSKPKIWLTYDPDFALEATSSVNWNYISSQLAPEVEKVYRKLLKQDKVKFSQRNTRHARYLITLAQTSWPHLKEIVLTTSSGDQAFDTLCAKALKETELPELPNLIQAHEQKVVFKCELWGKD